MPGVVIDRFHISAPLSVCAMHHTTFAQRRLFLSSSYSAQLFDAIASFSGFTRICVLPH